MSYIGFENSLSLSATDTTDVYDFMAGGLFDATYAGGYRYNALNLPSPDLRSFFINQSFNLSASILELNEDFCEFALMPIQIMILSGKDFYSLEAFMDVLKEVIRHKKDIVKFSDKEGAKFSDKLDTRGYALKGNLKEFANEILADSFLEDGIEDLAHTMFGVAGSMMAGFLYDAVINGKFESANIGEALYGEFKNLAINSTLHSSLSALGTSVGLVGGLGLSMAVNALVNELFEVATGLDNSFGFGGDLVGFMRDRAVYQESLGFVSGVKNLFGGLDFYRVVDYKGNVMGYVDSSGIYEYKSYPSIKSVMLGEKFGKLEAQKVDKTKISSKDTSGYNSKFTTGVKLDRFGNMSFELSLRTDVGFSGNLQDVLDDIVKNSIFGLEISVDIRKNLNITQVSTPPNSVNALNLTTDLTNQKSSKESFSRDKSGKFSFSNTQAGNFVEAMGQVGFGRGSLSIKDLADAMRLSDSIGKEKDKSSGGFDGIGKFSKDWGDAHSGFGW